MEILSYQYMQNAFIAGGLIALLSGTVGWFLVLRAQAYAGHTLSLVGFPGAAAAVLLGGPPLLGLVLACLAAAVVLLWLAPDPGEAKGQSGVIATVQVVALGVGLLLSTHFHGFLSSTTAFLFGSFLGITRDEVITLAVLAAFVTALMVAIYRPLLFASVDGSVSQSVGVPSRVLSACFLVALAVTVAGTSQFTGSLLVFGLLVAPPATAQSITTRPGLSMALSVVIALSASWGGLTLAFYTNYPVGFLVSSIAAGVFLIVRIARLFPVKQSARLQ